MVVIEKKKVFTLVMVLDEKDRKILLGMKKRGFGSNLWNGFGGKLEPGETILAAAHRELEEECLITVKQGDMVKIGVNLFTFAEDPVALEVHIFRALTYDGIPTETEEMRPEWFSYEDIPFESMWADDREWMPYLLSGQPFAGEFHFAKDSNIILSQDLRTMTAAPDEIRIDQRTLSSVI
ncbi:NUDIX hydrolase domain-like protein [Dichotomocladium elegans]|nr:NUDIX hydrolase domain-like protein [Dichotomocladium elegans]